MRILIAGAVFPLVAAILIPVAGAQDQTKSWTGWISDSECRLKGMSANHTGCAAMCVKNGAKWVLVDSATQKVLIINNQNVVDPATALGHEVKATGQVTQDGSIQIDSIKPAHTK
jgi:hypothetical protein